jgi:cysteine desulfurase
MRPGVRDAIVRVGTCAHGNPASVHRAGQSARRALEQAREQVAELVGASPRAIVFTSGGTESNNLAISGAVRAAGGDRRCIVTSAIEHSSIIAPLAELESQGFEIIRLAPDRDGRVNPDAVAAAIDQGVALVTLGLVNAEIGTVMEVAPVARRAALMGAVFHLDAAQAAGRIELRAQDLGCDLMTLSAHKMGGPSGIGALFVRPGLSLPPALLGGPQEHGLRAGTPNLIGAIGFGAAAVAVSESLDHERARVAALADLLRDHLIASIAGLRLNGPREGRVGNTLNLTFPGVLGESMLIALDLEGVEVSMGSACAAGAVEPSHVLIAMGRSAAEARSSLRISLGWSTSADDIAQAAEIIPRVWRRVANAEPAFDAEALR